MSSVNLELIAIVLDTGPYDNESEKYKDFLQKAKKCISNIIFRKMFSQSDDAISLILFGSDKTNNDLADGEYLQYENINVMCPFMKASWNFLEGLSEIQQTDISSDWLSAVVVGIHCLREKIEETKYLKTTYNVKKLVLLSTFSSKVSDDQVDSIVDGMKEYDIEFIAIGPDILDNFNTGPEDTDFKKIKKEFGLTESQELVTKVFDELKERGGVLYSVDDALSNLASFSRKKTKRMRWISTLNIGTDISIPINGYKMIAPNQIKVKTTLAEENFEVRRDTGFFKGVTPVDRSDIVYGYTFADKIIPFSETDMESLKYQCGEKGMWINGFLKENSVPRHLLIGDSAFYIVGDLNDKDAQEAIAALVKALHEMKMVALSRKVFSKDRGLTVGLVFPKIDANPAALVFVEVPYSEDLRYLSFPSLEKYNVTDEQLDAIDKLIDSMDLSQKNDDDEEEEEEPYSPETLKDLKDQYFLHCIAQKGLRTDPDNNPRELFKVPKFIEDLMKPLPHIQENSKEALEKIRELFPLETIKKREKMENPDASMDEEKMEIDKKPDIGEDQLGDVNTFFNTEVKAVGSLNPIDDFLALIKKATIPVEFICDQMQKVIMKLLVRADNVENLQKTADALKCLRDCCIENRQHEMFNNWMVSLKEDIIKRNQKDFWDIIVKDKLGLITSKDLTFCYTCEEDGEEFLKYELSHSYSENEDFDDLLENL